MVEGCFTGTVTAFRKEGLDDVYAMEYKDGDFEELGDEECKCGYELWLRQLGLVPVDVNLTSDPKAATHKKKTPLSKTARERLAEVIDLTAASPIAGKHLKTMSDSLKSAVIETAEKTHKKLENKNVKAAVLEVQYAALCHVAFVGKVTPATQMQHGRR
jgi:hypothetical protein